MNPDQKTVTLTSPKPFLTVTIRPSVTDFHPQLGTRVVEKAIQLKFHNYRCVVPVEWMPLVEASPAFTGGPRSPKVVFLEDDALAVDGGLGPVAVRGAVTAPVRRAENPPSPDWDDLGARVLSERIASGEVKDVLGAMAWESDHKKRKTVLQALAHRLADGGDADEAPAAPIAESFEAEAA